MLWNVPDNDTGFAFCGRRWFMRILRWTQQQVFWPSQQQRLRFGFKL
jgi:hypothetical protein